VDPRVGLNDVEKRKFLTLPALELRPLGRSARSQSLYRLRYPGCTGTSNNVLNREFVIKFSRWRPPPPKKILATPIYVNLSFDVFLLHVYNIY
jgi:hypothetical protein